VLLIAKLGRILTDKGNWNVQHNANQLHIFYVSRKLSEALNYV
jgi:hypothetical protein